MRILDSHFQQVFWAVFCHSLWSIPLIGLAFSYGLEKLSPARGDRRFRLAIIACCAGPALIACLFQSVESNYPVPAESHFEFPVIKSSVTTASTPVDIQPVPEQVQAVRSQITSHLISVEHIGHKAILWMIFAWLAGILILTGRLIAASTLFRMTSRIEMCDPNLRKMAEALAERMNLTHPPVVLISKSITQPLVTGLLRPEIILPFDYTIGLDQDQIEAVIAHELAHVRRNDLVYLLIQRLAAIVWFFHPAIHKLNRKASLWREMATDRLATDVTGNPLALARALESAALSKSRSSHLESFAIMFSSPKCRGRLGTRIQALLGPKGFCPMKISGKLRIAYLILAIAFAVPLTKLAAIAQEPEKKQASTITSVAADPFVKQVKSITDQPAANRAWGSSVNHIISKTLRTTEEPAPNPNRSFEVRLVSITGKDLDSFLNENSETVLTSDGQNAWIVGLKPVMNAANSHQKNRIHLAPKTTAADGESLIFEFTAPVTTVKYFPVHQGGESLAVKPIIQTTEYDIRLGLTGMSGPQSTRVEIKGLETMPQTIRKTMTPSNVGVPISKIHAITETVVAAHSDSFGTSAEIPLGKSLVIKLGRTIEETRENLITTAFRLTNHKLWKQDVYPYSATQRYLIVTPSELP
jgi:Zn-dependent protease with chaperone function